MFDIINVRHVLDVMLPECPQIVFEYASTFNTCFPFCRCYLHTLRLSAWLKDWFNEFAFEIPRFVAFIDGIEVSLRVPKHKQFSISKQQQNRSRENVCVAWRKNHISTATDWWYLWSVCGNDGPAMPSKYSKYIYTIYIYVFAVWRGIWWWQYWLYRVVRCHAIPFSATRGNLSGSDAVENPRFLSYQLSNRKLFRCWARSMHVLNGNTATMRPMTMPYTSFCLCRSPTYHLFVLLLLLFTDANAHMFCERILCTLSCTMLLCLIGLFFFSVFLVIYWNRCWDCFCATLAVWAHVCVWFCDRCRRAALRHVMCLYSIPLESHRWSNSTNAHILISVFIFILLWACNHGIYV